MSALTGQQRATTYTWVMHAGMATVTTPQRMSLGGGAQTGLVLGQHSIGTINSGGHVGTISPVDLTAARTVKLPDASGTLVLYDEDGNLVTGGLVPRAVLAAEIATDLPAAGELVVLPDHSWCTCVGDGVSTVDELPWRGEHTYLVSEKGTPPAATISGFTAPTFFSNADTFNVVLDAQLTGADFNIHTKRPDAGPWNGNALGGGLVSVYSAVTQSAARYFRPFRHDGQIADMHNALGTHLGELFATSSGRVQVIYRGRAVLHTYQTTWIAP